MIQFRRKDLNQNKLNELLSIKIDRLISEYLSNRVRHEAATSQESVEHLRKFLMESEYLDFSNDDRLYFCGTTFDSLTIDDLLDNDVLDEEFGVYQISYDAHQDFYGVECRLLGIYSSLSAVQSQIERIKSERDKSNVIEINDLNIKFVSLDSMVDIYLDSYIE